MRLPDVRDGLKPVHKRILWAMLEAGYRPDRPHRKCAAVIGDVLKKYHPHGDQSVYDALVRMAQDWSLRYPLVDGHGNFGSVDGDPAAAYRYTEARLAPMAMEMLRDIEAETVDFVPNFDGYEQQPVVLPSRFPNLLVNGSGGIAVGMATNIPPHNLGETIDAVVHFLENPDATPGELMKFVKGPDFPTGATIMGRQGIRDIYETGRGSIKVRAVTQVEEGANGRSKIVVTELPYQVNKARLAEKIAELVKLGKIKDIADLKDESNREGMRLVIECKRCGEPAGPAEPALQDDAAAGVVRRHHARARRRRAAHAEPGRDDRLLRRPPGGRDHPAHPVPVAQGRGARPHRPRAVDRARSSGRGHRHHPRVTGRRGRAEATDDEVQAVARSRRTTSWTCRCGASPSSRSTELQDEHTKLLEDIKYFNSLLKDPKLLRGVIKEEILEIRKKHADARRTKIMADEGRPRHRGPDRRGGRDHHGQPRPAT